MADVSRSQSDLLTNLFQDGQNRGISAQDIRDLVVSVTQPYGGVYFSTPVETVISGAGSYVKALGTTTESNSSSDVDTSVNNRIQFTGAAPRHFHIVSEASVELASGNNQDIGLQVWFYDDSAASGSLLAHSEAHTTIAGTDIIQITTHADVMLDTNDYIELHVANHSSTNNFTLQYGYLFMSGMLM